MLEPIKQKIKGQSQILIDLKVTPKSKNNQIIECFEQLNGRVMLRLKIQGAPEKGKVNQALIEFLAEQLSCPKSHLKLVSGMTSRNKIIQLINNSN